MPEGARKARVSAPPSLRGYTLSATLSVSQHSASSRAILFPWESPKGYRRTTTLASQKYSVEIVTLEDGLDALYTILSVVRSKLT